MQTETQKPQNQKNCNNCPQHGNLLIRYAYSKAEPALHDTQRQPLVLPVLVVPVLLMVVVFIFICMFGGHGLHFCTVNFRKERPSRGGNRYFAEQ